MYRLYQVVLRLRENQQYMIQALAKSPFDRAATYMRTKRSANTLHRRLIESSPDEGDEEEYVLVVVDATDVPKWEKVRKQFENVGETYNGARTLLVIISDG